MWSVVSQVRGKYFCFLASRSLLTHSKKHLRSAYQHRGLGSWICADDALKNPEDVLHVVLQVHTWVHLAWAYNRA